MRMQTMRKSADWYTYMLPKSDVICHRTEMGSARAVSTIRGKTMKGIINANSDERIEYQPKVNLELIPGELKTYDQWVCWRYEERSGEEGRVSKRPYSVEGTSAKVNDSTTWNSYENVVGALDSGSYEGIGFNLTEDDPYCVIDYDHVRNPITGEWNEGILEEIMSFGSFSEVSPSGEGAHVFIKGSVPGTKNRNGCREMYDSNRYFTVTGNHIGGTPFEINEASYEILQSVYEMIDPAQKRSKIQTNLSSSSSDFEIIDKCRSAKNAAKFKRLYEGNWEGAYKSHSEADLALCSIFAYYTQDTAQIDRLFIGSRLNSEKWDRDDYRERTITKALQRIQEDPQRKYFTEKGAFIAKALSDDLMSDRHFFTLEENGQIYVYENGVYILCGENIIRQMAQGRLQELSKRHHLSETIYYIQNETMISRSSINTDIYLINLKNGLYDVRQGKFMPHSPAVLSTVQIPVNYNQDATCPAIDSFLSEVVSEEDKQTLVEWMGYCMIPDYSIQKAVMLLGSGSNGKTVVLNLMREFIGNENCSTESLQYLVGDKYSTANLYGKLLNVCPDISSSNIRDTSIFKMLTGDEQRIRGEKKFQDTFNFKNTARQIFSANDLPPVENGNYAYFRRWMLIEFPKRFEGAKADRSLRDKLTTEEELSGLLNEALVALKRLLANGAFTYSKTEAEVEMLYRIKSDNVAAFANECVQMSTDDTLKTEMYNAYTQWCNKQGIKAATNSQFGKKFKNLGYESSREGTGKRNYLWEGVSVTIT